MSQLDALKSLHTSLIDAVKGYDTAVERTDSGEVKIILQEMRFLHLQAHNEIDGLLQSKGEIPDESGSIMSSVHQAVITVRSAVTGLDRSSLKSFVDGEERILTAYDDAIRSSEHDAGVIDVLRRQRGRLTEMVEKMRREGEA